MTILAKVGERSYEFDSMLNLAEARNIYAHHTGGQNEFEEIMENEGIKFYICNEG